MGNILTCETLETQLNDTHDPYFKILKREILYGRNSKYQVEHIMGEGSYGMVANCLNLNTKESVAVKILTKRKDYTQTVKQEVEMLENISVLDSDRWNLVRWHESFVHKGHACLVFEKLDTDLWTFTQQSPLSIQEIRPIVQQVAMALCALKKLRLIHSDLKPENIMLVDHPQSPCRVKLIDFGVAQHAHSVCRGTKLQPLFYRAPEVTLGLPITEAVDMWSLGCVMAALLEGAHPYWGANGYDLLHFITKTEGLPQQALLSGGAFTGRYFKQDWGSSKWRLKTHSEYYTDTGKTATRYLPTLDYFVKLCQSRTNTKANDGNAKQDTMDFLNLLKRILVLDGSKRITPIKVLRHPFLTRRVDNTATSPKPTQPASPRPVGSTTPAPTSDIPITVMGLIHKFCLRTKDSALYFVFKLWGVDYTAKADTCALTS